MDISGWVENTDDGQVEAEFSGEKEKVDQLVDLCHEGPALARVKKVVILK